MSLKKMLGRLVFGKLDATEASLGQQLTAEIRKSLPLQPVAEFGALADLHDRHGNASGSIAVYSAEKLDRAAFLTIDILPGMRYMNIHIIPDHHYRLPRFNFEGMVSTRGSQLSMDLYPDHDIVEDFAFIRDNYAGIAAIWEQAGKHREIQREPSRLPHLRALCSPYFLLANRIPVTALGDMEGFGIGYFHEWLTLYQRAQQLDAPTAAAQLRRRQHIARTIIDNDPDRDKVVDVYGEALTQEIERAVML